MYACRLRCVDPIQEVSKLRVWTRQATQAQPRFRARVVLKLGQGVLRHEQIRHLQLQLSERFFEGVRRGGFRSIGPSERHVRGQNNNSFADVDTPSSRQNFHYHTALP